MRGGPPSFNILQTVRSVILYAAAPGVSVTSASGQTFAPLVP
jgi:hypothetical protein